MTSDHAQERDQSGPVPEEVEQVDTARPGLNRRIGAEHERARPPDATQRVGEPRPEGARTDRPAFQLPFRCGQTWRASTYDGHYPDQDSLDLLRFSRGTNVSAGEPVLASAAGIVDEAHDTNAEDPPYGSVVTIVHNSVWRTQYIHLDDALSVAKGDYVGRGQKIGTVGGAIKIFGTKDAHLHYTQWQGSNGVRSVFNGVPTAVHAGAKDANGNYPLENLTSANCPVAAVGIARGGDWANSYWISTSRKDFEERAQQLFDDRGRRLVWVTTYVENGQRRWAGIARSGDWANSFWVSATRQDFETRAQELFDDRGRRLVHVHTYGEGSQRRWVGIARSGDWASSFWVSHDRPSFEAKAQQLFDDRGRRLIHVHTYPDQGARRWVGIARSGDWANSFWISSSWAAFRNKAQQLFDDRGRRLVHVHTYVEGATRHWVGIARGGNWANSLWVSGNVDSFNHTAQQLFDDKGRRLVVAEFLH